MDNSTDSSDDDELIAQLEFYAINNLLAKSPVLNDLRLTENYPNRNEDYYEVTIPRYSLEEFRSHFRMSRSCFAAFREKSGGYIPGVVGAIDGCHIQIKQPLRNPIDYYNRKNTHSIILQGVCDYRCCFTDVHIGAPGRQHDARVFRNSPLYHQMDEIIFGEYHLLGDAAYPLKNNLVTPFRDNGHLTPRQVHFNTRLSSARVTIERTFGLLKVRFRRLKYLDVAEPLMANKIIASCCILHNHIQRHSPDDMHDVVLDILETDEFENIIIENDRANTIQTKRGIIC